MRQRSLFRTRVLYVGRVGALAALLLLPGAVEEQLTPLLWGGHGRNAQHTAVSSVATQPLNRIHWQAPVDLAPQYSGDDLLIHYGSPMVTRSNTVIVPVKTGATDGFQLEARRGSDGTLLWTLATDYSLPPHGWTPSFSPALTRLRVWLPGGGGTLYYRTRPDSALRGRVRRMVFYGRRNFNANPNAYLAEVYINTPITVDTRGNLFFGFQVTGPTPLNLQSGIARISRTGRGRWVAAAAAAGDGNITKVVHNCGPALSNDQKTVYVAVSEGNGQGGAPGYLLALNGKTLATTAAVRLHDPATGVDASLHDDGTASPTVGPDGDVYFGILEAPFFSHHGRGWLLHFDPMLQPRGAPGAFGWDHTASVVPAATVASYQGGSSYLLMTKYNDYVQGGGDGVNRIAVVDPNDTMSDPLSAVPVMREVLTVAGPTPDDEFRPDHPNAVREWCINTAAVDPLTRSVLANNEDGILYRWDLTTGTLSESIVLTSGIGEAYTPTVIGPDGTVYAINNATLFAVGQ